MTASQDPLASLLRADRLTAIVDIGANPIDGEPPYKRMLAKRMCTLVGFEPQADALARLNAGKGDLETYLPYAVGDGKPGTLNVCQAPGMTSLFKPNPRVLSVFANFVHFGRVVREIEIETRTLDSITEIGQLDFLKIDVQGSELAIFNNGKSRLENAVAVHTEVSFVPLYLGQPVFGDVDLALRELGFIPHMFAAINRRMILPLHSAGNPALTMNQLLEADVVYVRDFTDPESMTPEQLKHLAIIAHHCYQSYDLATNCLHQLMQRGAMGADAIEQYLAIVKGNA
jgi:FkbM family methyltransferase